MTTPPAIIQREEYRRMEACVADMRRKHLREDVLLGNIRDEAGRPVLWVGVRCAYRGKEAVAVVYDEMPLNAQAGDYHTPRVRNFIGRLGIQVRSFLNLWDGYR